LVLKHVRHSHFTEK